MASHSRAPRSLLLVVVPWVGLGALIWLGIAMAIVVALGG